MPKFHQKMKTATAKVYLNNSEYAQAKVKQEGSLMLPMLVSTVFQAIKGQGHTIDFIELEAWKTPGIRLPLKYNDLSKTKLKPNDVLHVVLRNADPKRYKAINLPEIIEWEDERLDQESLETVDDVYCDISAGDGQELDVEQAEIELNPRAHPVYEGPFIWFSVPAASSGNSPEGRKVPLKNLMDAGFKYIVVGEKAVPDQIEGDELCMTCVLTDDKTKKEKIKGGEWFETDFKELHYPPKWPTLRAVVKLCNYAKVVDGEKCEKLTETNCFLHRKFAILTTEIVRVQHIRTRSSYDDTYELTESANYVQVSVTDLLTLYSQNVRTVVRQRAYQGL
eukprot:PhF_6_TR2440/c0_g1_i1/m.4268